MANTRFSPLIFLPLNTQNQPIINQEQQSRVSQGNQLPENYHSESYIDIYSMSNPLFTGYMEFPELVQDFGSQNLFGDNITLDDPLSDEPTPWDFDPTFYPTSSDTYMLPESLYGAPDVSFDIPLNEYQPPLDLTIPPQHFKLPLWEPQYENSNSTVISPEESNNSPYSYVESSTSTTSPSTTTSSSPPLNITYQCPDCHKTFTKRHLYNRHIKIHTKPHTCPHPDCTYQNATSRDLQRHINANHPESPHAKKPDKLLCPYKGCKHATAGFARPDHLKRHLKLHRR